MARTDLSPDDVAQALEFSPGSAGRRYVEELAKVDLSALSEMPGVVPEPIEAEQAREFLGRVGVDSRDIEAVVSTLPSPDRSPAWWWCVERAAARLNAEMGNPEAPRGHWPSFEGPRHDLERRCHFFHVALGCIPQTVSYWQSLGVPDDLAWAALSDIGRHAGIHRRMFGDTGMEAAWWVTLCLRGEIVDLGCLQYNRFVLGSGGGEHLPLWYSQEEAAKLGPGFMPGDGCLGIHIPDRASFAPELVARSLEMAGTFFATYLPSRRRRLATCMSWLLDDQLAEYLAAESNIVSFQQRFTLVPGALAGDQDVLQFVFRKPLGVSLGSLPQRTRMEKAAVAHLQAGRHWHVRTGWLELA